MKIDMTSQAVRQNPYPAYEKIRHAGSAVYDKKRNVWYVGRYDDVFEVLRNSELFSNKFTGVESTLLGADGSLHTRSRNIIRPAFTAERITSLNGAIRSLVEKLAERIGGVDKSELIGDFAVLIPTTGITWMLGMDDTRPDDLRRWSAALIESSRARRHVKNHARPILQHLLSNLLEITGAMRLINKKYTDTMDAVAECKAFLMEHFNQAKENPGDGWLIDLLVNSSDSNRLSTDELLNIGFNMIVAGTETTTDLIGNAALILASEPQIQEHLRDNPQLLEPFVEEVLRFDSPVQRRPRVTKRPVKIGDVDIPEGSQIEALIGSANRDPEKFPDADQFRINREPNRHITFGAGPHFCIGAQLARLEATIALDALIRKLPKMTLDGSTEDIIYHKQLSRRGPQQLPVVFSDFSSGS